jgi:hypothetical protein
VRQLLRDAGFVARYHQVEQAVAPRFATDERNRMFAAPRDLPQGRQVLALSICAFALIASQVAYWLAVSPGDRFYFPSYPFYTGRGEGLDAVAAGYVGSSIAVVGVVVLSVALVFSWRESVNAWPAGAAAASLAAVTAGTFLGASIGFAFDLPALLAAIALVAGSSAALWPRCSASIRQRGSAVRRGKNVRI